MTENIIDRNAPIGVFDSGFGGLSAVRELQALLPSENIVYFGDTARVPYGTRSRDTLRKYAVQDANFLASNNVKTIVIACGTVSSVAYDIISENYDLPVVGIVSPACKAASEVTRNGIIGIWGTGATIKSRSFENEINRLGESRSEGFRSIAVACPMLVPLIENGYIDEDCEMTSIAVREYLTDIISAGADTLILGCTHYPLISDIIEREWHKFSDGKIINSGEKTALEVKRILHEKDLLNDGVGKGYLKIYSSDDMETFSHQAKIFLRYTDKNSGSEEAYFSPDKIEIEKY
ncbi:MAG: glutamate racemase [Ruminococcaceae bacterium]|nr:glutamate racemase [Oscillospiraceae bacterium]